MTTNPRVTLITGGGTGIGAACAEAFAAAGDTVVICGRRPGPLQAVAERTGAHVHPCDLDDPAAVTALIDTVVADHGRLDTLVLNAALAREAMFPDLTDADWSATLATNLQSPVRMIRHALPHLQAARGSIVGVASVAALRSGPSMSAYSASKAALIALMRGVAVEYAARGIRANAVCPGWVRTEMADDELQPLMAEHGWPDLDAAYAGVTAFVPMRRPGEAAEVAEAVLYLARASYLTGVALPVDGGASIVDVGALAMG